MYIQPNEIIQICKNFAIISYAKVQKFIGRFDHSSFMSHCGSVCAFFFFAGQEEEEIWKGGERRGRAIHILKKKGMVNHT